MIDLDDLDLFPEPDDREPRPCKHPKFRREQFSNETGTWTECGSCGHKFDPVHQKRGRNNRVRGGRAELDVARLLGMRKVGPIGLKWDVEAPGWARLQVKKLAKWPSLNQVNEWMDEIPVSSEMRGVVLIAPGRGGRKLIVLDLDEFAEHHGRGTE